MSAWLIVFIAVCVVVCALQLVYTRQHNRRLDRHNEELRKIYERHG